MKNWKKQKIEITYIKYRSYSWIKIWSLYLIKVIYYFSAIVTYKQVIIEDHSETEIMLILVNACLISSGGVAYFPLAPIYTCPVIIYLNKIDHLNSILLPLYLILPENIFSLLITPTTKPIYIIVGFLFSKDKGCINYRNWKIS